MIIAFQGVSSLLVLVNSSDAGRSLALSRVYLVRR